MLIHNCLFCTFYLKNLLAIYLRHASYYKCWIFYIIPNIDDTFCAKMLKYKIKYKYNIYI